MKSLILVVALLALLIPQAASTGDCNGDVVVVGDTYLDMRADGTVWIYVESGAQPGYQRGGYPIVLQGGSDPCGDSAAPDLLVAHT